MGIGAAIFESAGKRTEHYIPGAFTRSNNVTSPSGVSSGRLCILGKATGGKPFTLHAFGSLSDAKDTLISGELLTAVAYAFNGSPDYIPQRVYAMRVNEGIQSSLTLSSGATEIVKLKAWDYGSHTNQLKLKIDNGTKDGTKKITTVYKDFVVTSDNVIRASFQITGAGESASVTVNIDSIVLNASIDGEQISETFTFEDYPTIADLVARINDTEYFVATMLDTNSDSKSAELDTVGSQDITSGYTLYSNFAEIVKVLKNNPFIAEVELLNTSRSVPENIEYTYFSGGSTGNYTTEEWTKALAALEAEDIQIVTTPSTNSAIHTLIHNHCVSMCSTENRKERTYFLGGELDESDETSLEKARAFNTQYGSYVADSVITANPLTGEKENSNGAILACMLAGMEASMAVNMPLTNKTINVLGFRKIRTRTNIEKMLQGGVLVCNPDPEDIERYIVIRALTTYQGDDLIYNERSMVREDLYMNRDLRKRVRGAIGNPNLISPNDIAATLNQAASEWLKAGYIVANGTTPVWGIGISINGDKIKVTYSRYLTAPLNFIFITATNHVYTSTTAI